MQKKNTTIETNLKNITTSKVDLAFEVDPMFQLMSEAFDEGGTMGLLHNTLRCFDDSQELVLDSNTVVNADKKIVTPQKNKPIDMSDLKGNHCMLIVFDIVLDYGFKNSKHFCSIY